MNECNLKLREISSAQAQTKQTAAQQALDIRTRQQQNERIQIRRRIYTCRLKYILNLNLKVDTILGKNQPTPRTVLHDFTVLTT